MDNWQLRLELKMYIGENSLNYRVICRHVKKFKRLQGKNEIAKGLAIFGAGYHM